jgi:hypothetical protein
MTFAELLAQLYDDLGYQSSPAAAVVTRIKRRVNRAHEAVFTEPGLAGALRSPLALTSVLNQARYGLSNVAQIRAMNTASSQRKLTRKSEAWYRATNPAPATNTGTPDFYIPLGHVASRRCPPRPGRACGR